MPDREQLLDDFELAWQRSPCPDVKDFFSRHGFRIELESDFSRIAPLAVEVLQIDMEWRLRSASPDRSFPLVCQYCQQFPALSSETRLALAIDEFRLGYRLRPDPYSPERFLDGLLQFPHADRLAIAATIEEIVATSTNAGNSPAEAPPEWGTLIGRYRIVRRIGMGGMGVVYEAEQESDVRRRVALKLLQTSLDGAEGLTRFQAERQTLAMMNHEHIARVYDAGVSRNGHPYFAMELVEGQILTEFCDQNRLSVRDRIQLFLQICEAIHHAHQKGILHRDIKPSNVLASHQQNGPVVKVIDFGVSKAIQNGTQPATPSQQTRTGRILGTLTYMSPEQAVSDPDIDVRSDIYSLGALLYELLTGSTPIPHRQINRMSVLEVIEAIQNQDPPRPSRRLEQDSEHCNSIAHMRRAELRQLKLELYGDLDWIIMKAIEKDRNRRYGSVVQLADDARRYLEGQTVNARPPSTSYRVKKFVRRHRGAVTACILTTGMLVLSTVISSNLMWKAQAESDRAEAELEKRRLAEQQTLVEKQQALAERDVARRHAQITLRTMTSNIRDYQSALRNVPGTGDIRQRLLTRVLGDIRTISTEHIDSLSADRTTMLGLIELGDVVMEVGVFEGTQRDLQLHDSALKTSEQLFRDALKTAQTLSHSRPGIESVSDLAISTMKVADVSARQGRSSEAVALYKQALEILNANGDSPLSDDVLSNLRFNCHQRLGDLAIQRGDLSTARSEFEQMSGPMEDGRPVADPIMMRNRTLYLERFATLAIEEHEFSRAASLLKDCVQIRNEIRKLQGQGVQEQRDLAITLAKLSEVQLQLDNPSDALMSAEESCTIRKSLLKTHPGLQSQSDSAHGLIFLTNCHIAHAQFENARISAGDAESLFRQLTDAEPTNVAYANGLSVAIRLQSLAEQLSGNHSGALTTITRCQDIREAQLRRFPGERRTLNLYVKGQEELGRLLMLTQKFSEAEIQFQKAIDRLQDLLTAEPGTNDVVGYIEICKWNRDGARLGVIANGSWADVMGSAKESLTQTLVVRCEILVPQRRTTELAETARRLLQQPNIDCYVVNDAARALAACALLEMGWDGFSGFGRESMNEHLQKLKPTAEQLERSHVYRAEALQALLRARSEGLDRFEDHWWDLQFTTLRDMAEFQQLCGRTER